MSRSTLFYQLQVIDSAMDAALARIQEIDRQLTDNHQILSTQKELETLRKTLHEKQKALSRIEHEVEDQTLKIDQNQKKLYGGSITNPKELADLQLEAESLQKYLAVLEDRQLEALLDYEQELEKTEAVENKLASLRENKEKEDKILLTEKQNLEDFLSIQKKKRLKKSAEIPPDDLDLYTKLRSQLGGIAAAEMKNSSCAACGSKIPSAVEQEAKSPSKLTKCTACGRVLHPAS